MNTKITFYSLGNADTTLIQLSTGKNILWDYADEKTDDKEDKRCNLPAELNKSVKGDFDVVCFTHADEDHINKMSQYFYLEYAKKYQEGDRKKIKELWVPAAIIVDTDSKNDDDNILKAEARYRLKQGKGIRVFSRPEKLRDWLENNGVDFDDVKHLIVDAGKLIPGWNKEYDGVEFFVHSPFMGHVDENTEVDRNESGILVQATFGNDSETKLILGADGIASVWKDVIKISKYKKHSTYLEWDIFHLPHHCSYTALNGEDKGKKKTTPVEEIKWLFETQGKEGCLIISPSKEITFSDTDQPPHFQAYNYYKEEVANKKKGTILVTMEEPSKEEPLPIIVEINDDGYKIIKGLTKIEKMAAAAAIAKTSIVTGNWAYDGKL